MTDSAAGTAQPAPGVRAAAAQWEWHEVVHSDQFSERARRRREAEPGWNWRYSWVLFSRGAAPMLITAAALTMALLTLVGVVARPFPLSAPPVFGAGGSGGEAAAQPAAPPPTPAIAARLETTSPLPTVTGTAVAPAVTAGAAGAASDRTPVSSSVVVSSSARLPVQATASIGVGVPTQLSLTLQASLPTLALELSVPPLLKPVTALLPTPGG